MVPWEEDNSRKTHWPSVAAYPARRARRLYLGLSRRHPKISSRPLLSRRSRRNYQAGRVHLVSSADRSVELQLVARGRWQRCISCRRTPCLVPGRDRQKWTGGGVTHAEVPLARAAHENHRNLSRHPCRFIDADNKPLHHGHFTVDVKGDRFALPCLTSNPIAPAPGAAPYTSRLWQFAIDENRTQIVRYAVWRARTAKSARTPAKCSTSRPAPAEKSLCRGCFCR